MDANTIRAEIMAPIVGRLAHNTDWSRVGTTEDTIFGEQEITSTLLSEYVRRDAVKLEKANRLCAMSDAELIDWYTSK